MRITAEEKLMYEVMKAIYDSGDVHRALNNSGKVLGTFDDFLHGTVALRHAYEKFRFEGGVNKPVFEEVYESVKEYIKDEILNMEA